jgi:aldehyde:ferredoxin oxidoreductase
MTYGYSGKILRVDLTTDKTTVEQPSEIFYRRYMGGGALGAYYLLKELEPGIDPLSPGNIIVFATGVPTGFPLAGMSRHSVISKSPLTNTIAESEAGGWWGPELKAAGYDAVVVKGRAEKPVYLWINDGKVDIKSAENIWGRYPDEAQKTLFEELGDKNVRIAMIGPGGERLVRYAAISNNLRHYNGRAGLGAVMGSKNLKAIAVRGKNRPKAADMTALKAIIKEFGAHFKESPALIGLNTLGSAGNVNPLNEDGQLPTKNFRTGYFEEADQISGEHIHETIFYKAEGCFACPIQCKMAVKAYEPYDIDPEYGGPEYEALASLGAYTMVSDIHAVSKASELCNKYGIDTISTGSSIAFAMECYENGIIRDEDTGGIRLKFGNAEALVKIVEQIGLREGLGDLLAEGTKRAAEHLGKGAHKYAMHVKGYEFPAHDPRAKQSVGLAYATNAYGADHMSTIHDPAFSPGLSKEALEPMNSFGLLDPLPPEDLSEEKVRFFYYTQLISSYLNALDVCMYVCYPMQYWTTSEFINVIKAISGWEVTQW